MDRENHQLPVIRNDSKDQKAKTLKRAHAYQMELLNMEKEAYVKDKIIFKWPSASGSIENVHATTLESPISNMVAEDNMPLEILLEANNIQESKSPTEQSNKKMPKRRDHWQDLSSFQL